MFMVFDAAGALIASFLNVDDKVKDMRVEPDEWKSLTSEREDFNFSRRAIYLTSEREEYNFNFLGWLQPGWQSGIKWGKIRFRTKKLRFRTKSPAPNYYDFAPNFITISHQKITISHQILTQNSYDFAPNSLRCRNTLFGVWCEIVIIWCGRFGAKS